VNLPVIDGYQLTGRFRLNGDHGSISGNSEEKAELRVVVNAGERSRKDQDAKDNRMNRLCGQARGAAERMQSGLEPGDPGLPRNRSVSFLAGPFVFLARFPARGSPIARTNPVFSGKNGRLIAACATRVIVEAQP